MATQSFEVQGLDELEKALAEIGAEMGVKTLRTAGRESMKPLLAAAKSRVPVDSGDTRDSLRIRTRVGRDGGNAVEVHVAAFGKKGYKAKWIEYGTAPHYINRGAKRSRSRDGRGKRRKHPGAKAQPFMRPAWDQTRDGVLRQFKERLAHRLALVKKRTYRVS